MRNAQDIVRRGISHTVQGKLSFGGGEKPHGPHRVWAAPFNGSTHMYCDHCGKPLPYRRGPDGIGHVYLPCRCRRSGSIGKAPRLSGAKIFNILLGLGCCAGIIGLLLNLARSVRIGTPAALASARADFLILAVPATIVTTFLTMGVCGFLCNRISSWLLGEPVFSRWMLRTPGPLFSLFTFLGCVSGCVVIGILVGAIFHGLGLGRADYAIIFGGLTAYATVAVTLSVVVEFANLVAPDSPTESAHDSVKPDRPILTLSPPNSAVGRGDAASSESRDSLSFRLYCAGMPVVIAVMAGLFCLLQLTPIGLPARTNELTAFQHVQLLMLVIVSLLIPWSLMTVLARAASYYRRGAGARWDRIRASYRERSVRRAALNVLHAHSVSCVILAVLFGSLLVSAPSPQSGRPAIPSEINEVPSSTISPVRATLTEGKGGANQLRMSFIAEPDDAFYGAGARAFETICRFSQPVGFAVVVRPPAVIGVRMAPEGQQRFPIRP